jgi:hypothetical protein
MIDTQLVIAVATPLAAVLAAWLNHRSTAATERERTRRLLITLQNEQASGPEPVRTAEDKTPEVLD